MTYPAIPVKALSTRQPRASLILFDEKTLEKAKTREADSARAA